MRQRYRVHRGRCIFRRSGSRGARKDVYRISNLKDPTDPAWKDDPEYKEWIAWMDKYYPEGDQNNAFNMYGYAVAQTFVQVLKQCGNNLTRANLMKEAANLKNFRAKGLLPGITINTSPTDFYPIEAMQMQRFENGEWVRFGEIVKAESS